MSAKEVTQLPCNLGDKVFICYEADNCVVGEVCGIHLASAWRKTKSHLLVWFKMAGATTRVPFDKIGKTVFFSEEEAREIMGKAGS